MPGSESQRKQTSLPTGYHFLSNSRHAALLGCSFMPREPGHCQQPIGQALDDQKGCELHPALLIRGLLESVQSSRQKSILKALNNLESNMFKPLDIF